MEENKETFNEEAEQAGTAAEASVESATQMQPESDFSADETDKTADETADETETNWEEKYTALNDKYLRQAAEFDNYRKRTVREKADLLKSGGEAALTALLPVIDDLERALNTIKTADTIEATIEGVKLIYDKFIAYLAQQGVKPVEAIGQTFNTELFEAIAMLPTPNEEQKGKVLDCVQTGYMLYDKVIRHAKVVVGE
jgi:molecular chaperone GrpE